MLAGIIWSGIIFALILGFMAWVDLLFYDKISKFTKIAGTFITLVLAIYLSIYIWGESLLTAWVIILIYLGHGVAICWFASNQFERVIKKHDDNEELTLKDREGLDIIVDINKMGKWSMPMFFVAIMLLWMPMFLGFVIYDIVRKIRGGN